VLPLAVVIQLFKSGRLSKFLRACKKNRDGFNLGAKRGVAIREFSLSTGATDYLLFVDREAVGTIEAKKVGQTVTGVEEQSQKYRTGLPGGLPAARLPPFHL
jgi:type I site-specific restriction endonuclease